MPEPIELMITAIFTGIGTATGLTLFEFYVKPKLIKMREFQEKLKNMELKKQPEVK